MASILVLEESFVVRHMVEGALNADGHRLVSAATPRKAVELVNSETFELLIIDLNLPDTDSLSIIRELRERPRWARVPVLVLADSTQESLRNRAMAWGATGYMLKPFGSSEVIAKVQMLLEATH